MYVDSIARIKDLLISQNDRSLADSIVQILEDAFASERSLAFCKTMHTKNQIFDEFCTRLYDLERTRSTGHPIYEILGYALQCNFSVIQLMNPSTPVTFTHSQAFITLYVLETDDFYCFLFPKPLQYKKVWSGLSQAAEEGKIDWKKAVGLLEEGENWINEKIHDLNYFHKCILKEVELKFIEAINTLNYSKKLYTMVRNNIQNSRGLTDELGCAVAIIKEESDFTVNDTNILSLLNVQVPRLPVPGLKLSTCCQICFQCESELSLPCGCSFCSTCMIKHRKYFTRKCFYCEFKQTKESKRKISRAIDEIQSKRRKETSNNPQVCKNCTLTQTDSIIFQLQCNHSICFDCIHDAPLCPHCKTELSPNDSRAISDFQELKSAPARCAWCSSLTVLCCNCLCLECTFKIFRPNTKKCNSCTASISQAILERFKIRFSQTCTRCKQSKNEDELIVYPCKCRICEECLIEEGMSGGLASCDRCRLYFKKNRIEELYKTAKTRNLGIQDYEPYCIHCKTKETLICNCTCINCDNQTEKVCEICQSRRMDL